MPHYADGTPAKHGDLVMRKEKHEQGTEMLGIVATISPGTDTCNAQVLPLAMRQKGAAGWLPMMGSPPNWHVTLSECSKLGGDDARMPSAFDTRAHVERALASG